MQHTNTNTNTQVNIINPLLYIKNIDYDIIDIKDLPESTQYSLKKAVEALPIFENSIFNGDQYTAYIASVNRQNSNDSIDDQDIPKLQEIFEYLLKLKPIIKPIELTLESASKQLNLDDPSNKQAFEFLLSQLCKQCSKLHYPGDKCALQQQIVVKINTQCTDKNCGIVHDPSKVSCQEAGQRMYYRIQYPEIVNVWGSKLEDLQIQVISTRLIKMTSVLPNQSHQGYKLYHLFSCQSNKKNSKPLKNYTGQESGFNDDGYRVEDSHIVAILTDTSGGKKAFNNYICSIYGNCTEKTLRANLYILWILHESTVKLFVDEIQYLITDQEDLNAILNDTYAILMTKFETNFIMILSCETYTINVQKVKLDANTDYIFKVMDNIRIKCREQIKSNKKNRTFERPQYTDAELNYFRAHFRIFKGCLDAKVKEGSNLSQQTADFYYNTLIEQVKAKFLLV